MEDVLEKAELEKSAKTLENHKQELSKDLEKTQKELESLEYLESLQKLVPPIPEAPITDTTKHRAAIAEKLCELLQLKIPTAQPQHIQNLVEKIVEAKKEKEKAIREKNVAMEDWKEKDKEVENLRAREKKLVEEKYNLQKMILNSAPYESKEFQEVMEAVSEEVFLEMFEPKMTEAIKAVEDTFGPL